MRTELEIQAMINYFDRISNDEKNNSIFREDARIKSNALKWVLKKLERIV